MKTLNTSSSNVLEYKGYKGQVDIPNFIAAKDGDAYHMDFEGHFLIEMKKIGNKLVTTGNGMGGRGNVIEVVPFEYIVIQ